MEIIPVQLHRCSNVTDYRTVPEDKTAFTYHKFLNNQQIRIPQNLGSHRNFNHTLQWQKA